MTPTNAERATARKWLLEEFYRESDPSFVMDGERDIESIAQLLATVRAEGWRAGVEAAMEHARRFYGYWLLKALASANREGWEPGPSVNETVDGIASVLWNIGLDEMRDAADVKVVKASKPGHDPNRALAGPGEREGT